MKRIISILMISLLLITATGMVTYAETENDEYDALKEKFHTFFTAYDDNQVKVFLFGTLSELADRNIISLEQFAAITHILATSDQNTYTFGKGTFIVGLDIKAGTYDITCKTSDQDGYSDSMNVFGDFYSQYGMQEYADMFNSLSGMTDTIESITIRTIDKNGYPGNMHLLKVNETARIILEDGMKLEIGGGSAQLNFVR